MLAASSCSGRPVSKPMLRRRKRRRPREGGRPKHPLLRELVGGGEDPHLVVGDRRVAAEVGQDGDEEDRGGEGERRRLEKQRARLGEGGQPRRQGALRQTAGAPAAEGGG